MDELWKDIPGYEGRYEASTLGRIRNKKNGHILKGWVNYGPKNLKGRITVQFKKDGKQRTFYVHRLVALTWIPNPDNLPQVNHKNENSLDNRVDNLEWCDAKYNANYGTRNERIVSTRKINSSDTQEINSSTLENTCYCGSAGRAADS